jgi:peroxiredoxin
MKTKTVLFSAPCLFGLLTGLAVADKLGVGDPAPELAVAKWVKGDPVKISDGEGKTIFVIEFWATWCPPCRASIPHLTKLQTKYKDHNVVVIGISDEAESKVVSFVEKMGDKMDYRVAVDDDKTTGKRYMEAAGQRGIPHAFVIDKNGRIAWQGHPMDSGLESALARLTGFQSDEEEGEKEGEAGRKERDEKQMAKLGSDLQKAFRSQDWDEALDILDEMLEIDKGNSELKRYMFIVLCRQGEHPDEIAELAGKIAKDNDDAETLNLLAWEMLTCKDLACRNPVLSMQIAERAYAASDDKDGHITDTLARAYYVAGELEEAIQLQKEAIAKAKGTQFEEDLKDALEYYEQCLEARKQMKKH